MAIFMSWLSKIFYSRTACPSVRRTSRTGTATACPTSCPGTTKSTSAARLRNPASRMFSMSTHLTSTKTITSELNVRLEQCDQIWRNFATLAKSSKSLAIFGGLIWYLEIFWTYLGQLLCNWTNEHCCKRPNIEINSISIWSHWSRAIFYQELTSFGVKGSVTRWLPRLFFNIWPFLQPSFCRI